MAWRTVFCYYGTMATPVTHINVPILKLIASAFVAGAIVFWFLLITMGSFDLDRSMGPYIFFLLVRPITLSHVLGAVLSPLLPLLACSLIWHVSTKHSPSKKAFCNCALFLVISYVGYFSAQLLYAGAVMEAFSSSKGLL
jgi:hypothetical protein